jgi:hypothetical protein
LVQVSEGSRGRGQIDNEVDYGPFLYQEQSVRYIELLLIDGSVRSAWLSVLSTEHHRAN